MGKGRTLGAAALGATLIGFGLLRNRIRRFEITEDSMAPSLRPGDFVLASRLNSAPLRGDVVVFPHPAKPSFLLIKRVVGVPTETVAITGGQVVANAHVVAEPWAEGALAGDFTWELDSRHVIVLSDNRRVPTEDSRELGPLALTDVWRVGFRYWPLSRFGGVR